MVIEFGSARNVSISLPMMKFGKIRRAKDIHANATLNGKVKDVRAI